MDEYENMRVVLDSGALVEFEECKATMREDTGALIVISGGEHHVYTRGRWVELHGKPLVRI